MEQQKELYLKGDNGLSLFVQPHSLEPLLGFDGDQYEMTYLPIGSVIELITYLQGWVQYEMELKRRIEAKESK